MPAAERPRVLVCTDIGGTDPDDFQSMVHLLLYADVLDIEGLLSSPYGEGRATDIHRVIDRYAVDLERLRRHGDFPDPASLHAVVRQGSEHLADHHGRTGTTDGSEWIVQCARADDDRPLDVLSGAAWTTSPRRCTTGPTSPDVSECTTSADRTRCGASTPTTTSSSSTRRCG